jgi:DNA-binding IclR family transcriptional regulator
LEKIRLVNRTLDILELFLVSNQEMRLSDLAELTGLDKSTVNRIAATLVDRGYLIQPEKRGKYSLGLKFLDYSGLIKRNSKIREIALPHLLKLSRVADESVILSIRDARTPRLVAYNETIPSSHALRIVPEEGTLFPLYCTAVGKIFLAAMSEADLENYLSSTDLKSYCSNTITDPTRLKANLADIIREGVAFDDEEFILGARGISAGIRSSEGRVAAAIAILGPAVRLTLRRMKGLVPDIKSCALDISRELGYKGCIEI